MAPKLSGQFLAYNSATDFHVPHYETKNQNTIQILKAGTENNRGFAVASMII